MAEVTAFRNNATDYPVYGLPWTVLFPILDADGDGVTGATGLDSEISINGDTPADCTNEATEVGTSCQYYLTFTASEMTADIVSWVTKTSSSGAKTTFGDLYPKKLPVLLTSDNAGAYDSTTTINLGAGASAIDDYYIGCIVYVYGGTGNGQVRMITDYVGSTKMATVHVAWATNPDATSDLKIYRTELAPYVAGTPQTGDVYAKLPTNFEDMAITNTTGLVDVNDKGGFSLAATGADLILKSSTFVQAIVAAINELATYGLTAINTLLVTTGIKTSSTAAPADMALDSTVMKATSYAAPPAASAIADAVLEESLADHKAVANSLAKTLLETNQRLNGAKVAIDTDAGTIKVYDTNGTDLLFTLTKTAAGNIYTIARS